MVYNYNNHKRGTEKQNRIKLNKELLNNKTKDLQLKFNILKKEKFRNYIFTINGEFISSLKNINHNEYKKTKVYKLWQYLMYNFLKNNNFDYALTNTRMYCLRH